MIDASELECDCPATPNPTGREHFYAVPHKSSRLTAFCPNSAGPIAKTNSRDVSLERQLEGVAADRSHDAGQRPLGGFAEWSCGSEESGGPWSQLTSEARSSAVGGFCWCWDSWGSWRGWRLRLATPGIRALCHGVQRPLSGRPLQGGLESAGRWQVVSPRTRFPFTPALTR